MEYKKQNKLVLYQAHTLYSRRLTQPFMKECDEKKEKSKQTLNVALQHMWDAKNCPERAQGPKGFKCNTFGRIANRCPSIEKIIQQMLNVKSQNYKILIVNVNSKVSYTFIDMDSLKC